MTTTPHKPHSIATPKLLANRYQVLRILGDGGFGTTYLATDTQMPSQRICVVKQLKPVEDNSQIHQLVQERFQREAAILETLGGSSSQIPALFAYFPEGDHFFLVEEWIEGETLTERIQRTGPLTESEVRSLLIQLLPIIDFIHRQQIVHRDIKPDNIILRAQDNQPVLIDFGAVKEAMGTVINSQGKSSQSIVVGTPGFMPPEQSAGRPVFSSDLYSLGLTAIFLLTGKIPQDLEIDPMTGQILWHSNQPHISQGLRQILDRAIHLQPLNRFMTALEMQQALSLSNSDTPTAWKSTIVVHPPLGTIQPPVTPLQTPQAPQAFYNAPPSQVSGKQDWIKAVIMGSLIGLSILGGTLILRAQFFDPDPIQSDSNINNHSPNEIDPIPSNDINSPPPKVSEVPNNIPSPAPKASTQVSPNATVSGNPGRKNIRSGPGTNYGVLGNVYPGDRVQVLGNGQEPNGFTWYEVLAPTANTRGWIAHHLVTLDGAQSTPVASAPPPKSYTNATVVGGGVKNIRSGPGTVHGVIGKIATSERVRIIGSDFDHGGYRWYSVIAGRQRGWIAAQLIEPD